MKSSFRLSARIWFSISILIIGYLFSLAFSYYISLDVQSKLPDISNFAITSTQFSQKVLNGFIRQTKFYEKAILLSRPEKVEGAKKEGLSIRKDLHNLKELEGIDEKLKAEIDNILTELEEYDNAANRIYDKMNAGADEPLVKETTSLAEKEKKLMIKLMDISIAVRNSLSRNVHLIADDLEKNSNINIYLSLSVVIISVIIIHLVIRHSIIGTLYRITEKLYESSRDVSLASSQISFGSQQLAEGASEQAVYVKDISASLDTMSSMTRQNAERMGQARVSRNEAHDYIQNVNISMEKAAEAMFSIRAKGREIEKIVKTIDEIAFQTNLLALNIAVEAARVGETGAGFVVVADEVRKLAARSAQAAKNTQLLIQKTVNEIDSGASLIAETKDAFGLTMNHSEKVGKAIEEIVSASDDQVQAIDEVNQTMTNISKVVQRNLTNAETFASLFIKLNGQTERIRFYIRKLKGLMERRGQIRIKITLKGIFRNANTGISEPFFTKDISASGALIITSNSIEIGSTGDVSIRFRNAEFPSVKAQIVRDKARTGDGRYIFGIQFLNINPAMEKELTKILNT
ncbi:methyl-accepting chemotaxis protein [Desulfococcaceae bacterium HSG8]|nr:methyl-accepting chemotaxis protein [Desulfococcaceae bacterium HSG8]